MVTVFGFSQTIYSTLQYEKALVVILQHFDTRTNVSYERYGFTKPSPRRSWFFWTCKVHQEKTRNELDWNRANVDIQA